MAMCGNPHGLHPVLHATGRFFTDRKVVRVVCHSQKHLVKAVEAPGSLLAWKAADEGDEKGSSGHSVGVGSSALRMEDQERRVRGGDGWSQRCETERSHCCGRQEKEKELEEEEEEEKEEEEQK